MWTAARRGLPEVKTLPPASYAGIPRPSPRPGQQGSGLGEPAIGASAPPADGPAGPIASINGNPSIFKGSRISGSPVLPGRRILRARRSPATAAERNRRRRRPDPGRSGRTANPAVPADPATNPGLTCRLTHRKRCAPRRRWHAGRFAGIRRRTRQDPPIRAPRERQGPRPAPLRAAAAGRPGLPW